MGIRPPAYVDARGRSHRPGAKAKQEVVFSHEVSRYRDGFTHSDEPVYGVWDAQVDIVILCRSVVVV